MELHEIKQLLQLNKEVFTLSEFCLYAGLSKEQVYKLTSSGRIKFYRPFGKKIYIKREDAINALLKNPVLSDQNMDQLSNHHFLTSKTAA